MFHKTSDVEKFHAYKGDEGDITFFVESVLRHGNKEFGRNFFCVPEGSWYRNISCIGGE